MSRMVQFHPPDLALPWIFVRAPVAGAALAVILACGGLPIPGSDGAGAVADAVASADEAGDAQPDEGDGDGDAADEGDGDGADDGDAGGAGDAESMFATLDPNEPPPYDKVSVPCPSGTMAIRHKSARFTVYCATGSGVRTGPYTEWSGGKLAVAATNADGKLDGKWTRWEKGADGAVHKVEEQTYAAGVAEGDYAAWDTSGRLLVRGKLSNGQRDGRFIVRTPTAGGEPSPGGACYEDGTEVWKTTDEAELASKACRTDAVAEGAAPGEG